MLPSELWLHVAFGFVFGMVSTIFVTGVPNQLKKGKSIQSLFNLFKWQVLFSFLITGISLVYAFAISGGALEGWHLLGYPGIDPASKIIDVGYVQGESGNIYFDNEGKWERVDKVTIDPEKIFVPISRYSPNCGAFPLLPLPEKDFVKTKSACMLGHGLEKIVYAIDRYGRVYSWSHTLPPEFNGMEIIFAVGGGLKSGMFGIVVIAIVLLSRFIISKTRKSDQSEIINDK